MNKVIITGAANGIGKAIVKRLHKQGAMIFACDIDVSGLAKLREELRDIKTYAFDIANEPAVNEFFEEIREIKCNWLVNNAGIYLGQDLLTYQSGEIERVFRINCFGAVYCTRFFSTNLIEGGHKGAIVNISSVSGQEGSSDAIYGMTKAAILGLTKSCAQNFAPLIRVNAIAPGLVNTDMARKIPSKRLIDYGINDFSDIAIQPEDVAGAVCFLLSTEAAHITGSTLDINCGHYLR